MLNGPRNRTPVWACTHQRGEPSYHDTESEAQARAHELVASGKATTAVFYRIDVEEQDAP